MKRDVPLPSRSRRHQQLASLALISALNCVAFADPDTDIRDAHLSLAMPVVDGPSPTTQSDLTQLSLEDLMDLQVTSVSRQKQRLGDAAAAIYVITQEDIQRSGMNAIPDLLRLAPGMIVGQVDASTWTVGSRGFNQVRTNNLQVLMDGRTVYTPLFGGVYWDMVDYILTDLDRIEVIRGPGATLWGSNAVNGVINIITKSAKDTQGGLLQTYAGTDGFITSARYGGNTDNRVFYRVYGKFRAMDDLPDPGTTGLANGWDSQREGFRVDAELTGQDQLTVQGDFFLNRAGHPVNTFNLATASATERSPISDTTGGNFLTRYTHTISDQSDFSIQAYYDHISLYDHNNRFKQDTFEVEFQHRFPLLGFQEIIWGGEYRAVADDIRPLGAVTIDGDFTSPTHRTNSNLSGFIQDDITLIPQKLHLIAGTKLEMTPYTGFEFQPSARLLLTPNTHNTLWAGISRAIRAPQRAENDGHVLGSVLPTPGLPTAIDYRGNRDLKSEQLLALEAGYRVQPVKNLTIDLAAFYNLHHGIVATRSAGAPFVVPTGIPHVVVPVSPTNEANGNSYGLELSAKWKATDQLTLQGSYSFLQVSLDSSIPGNDGGVTALIEQTSPRHQAQLHAYYDITKDLQLNAAAYFVDELRVAAIPAYVRADVNVVWRPQKDVELTAGVRNIFDSQHKEFQDFQVRSTANEVPRTFFVQLSVKF